MTIAEDLEVCLSLFRNANFIIHVPLALYNYDISANTSSLMKRRYTKTTFTSDKELLESIKKLIHDEPSLYLHTNIDMSYMLISFLKMIL